MYEKAKKAAKKILPEKMVKNNEAFLRGVAALKYKGSSYSCNVCGFQMSKFVLLNNGDRLCAKCGSLPRTRRLHDFLINEVGIVKKSILHFSPSKAMSTRLGTLGPSKYVTTDYEGEFEADKQYDITNIDVSDNKFDLVICFHVLEHIQDDSKAMSELYRIVKNGGVCLIQTPFKEGEIYENESIVLPEDRLEHFGQEDHVRIYSIKGLRDRLELVGFSVRSREFHVTDNDRHGMDDKEVFLIARKT